MKKTCLLIAATAFVLSACGSDKPAPSDDTKQVTDSAVTPTVAAPAAVEPSAPAARPAATAKPAVAGTVTPAPSAAKPVVVPPPPPPAPVVTPTPAPAAVPSAPPVDPLTGKPLYDAQCRKCHGIIGIPPKVIKEKFPRILPFDAAYFSKTTDDAVVTILVQGKGDDMKSFKDKMTRAEMVAVAAYIRTLGQRP